MVGLSPVHDSIYFGSLLFLISFITTALFPSALYLLGAVLCPTHLNPLLSCVSVLCEVKKKKKKPPIFIISSFLFWISLQFRRLHPWNLGCWLFLGWLQPISQVSVTLTSLKTIIEVRRHNLGTKKTTKQNKKKLLDNLLGSLHLGLTDLQ